MLLPLRTNWPLPVLSKASVPPLFSIVPANDPLPTASVLPPVPLWFTVPKPVSTLNGRAERFEVQRAVDRGCRTARQRSGGAQFSVPALTVVAPP